MTLMMMNIKDVLSHPLVNLLTASGLHPYLKKSHENQTQYGFEL